MPEFLPFVRRWFDAAFHEATPPQRDGWEAIASGRDTLIVAPTGSGKTLAAFLWALDHLHRLAVDGTLEDRVYVVYVSPLRALNNDIEKNLRAPLAGIRDAALADGLDLPQIRVAVRTGDTLASARQAMARRPPHVLITTPESLFILLTTEKFRTALARARFVIVDEVHALMGGKRGAHLALSLERLQALVVESEHGTGERPQRIGCSATVRPVEDALRFLTGETATGAVAVDAGFSRDLDIGVLSPVDDFLTSQSDTVWEAALQQVTELVEAHRTTLVFAPSRRSAERLARNLNDRLADHAVVGDDAPTASRAGGPGEERDPLPPGLNRVAAHHGSLSRRARLDAENRLKDGQLKALVATSSLELGIDVGSIDLVIQLQSPRNVAAALQRVGRAGHLLSKVSKGRFVVTKGEELVEAAAVVRTIRARQLDRIAVPEAPLDVLAQQIVASVAVESMAVDDMLRRFQRAAPYRNLSREEFLSVVRSLAEPLPREVKGIAPRILWDRVNDRLHARRGSRFLSLTSGGTIPDSGLYDVYVAETDLKVGTLDEEFVTESLPGDVFLLGSHPWKIAKVRADRVLVEDASGMSPTVPFWRGEHPSRSYDLGVAVGRLRRDAAERIDQPDFADWAARECGLDAQAAGAFATWLRKAGELLDGVPDDEGVVVESFADDMGGRHAMIHSVFGMRVNGAWGMALQEKVRRTLGLIAEASHVDDGILLSFAPGQVPPSPGRLVTLVAPDEVDTLLGEALIGSPLFTTRFRHAAVRALFIPRSQGGQRTPAWLQRLKADALIESVGGQPDFPIVAETLRECFNDALDVPRLKTLLERLQAGAVWTRHVDTPMPSPFVYPLLQAWDWAYLDAGHAEERRSDAVQMRKAWNVPAGPLRPDIVAGVEAELQRTAPERRARDANELAAMLDDLGDLTLAEIADRATADAQGLVDALLAERRVVALDLPNRRRVWIGALDEPLYRTLTADAGLEKALLRVVRSRGPVTPAMLADRYAIDAAHVTRVLDRLEMRGLFRKGEFLPDRGAPQYLHIAVLDQIQRRQAHSRRVPRPVATADRFSAFLLRRHHLHPDHRLTGSSGVLAALELLQGEDFPVRVWEQDFLPARVEGYRRDWLDELGLAGEIVFTPFERKRSGRVGVALRENLGWLREPLAIPADLDELAKAALRHLEVRGASFAQDVARLLHVDTSRAVTLLWDLFWAGLVTPDAFGAIVAGAAARSGPARHAAGGRGESSAAQSTTAIRAEDPPRPPAAYPGANGRRRPQRRGQRRALVPPTRLLGRWSAIAEEEPLSPEDRDEARANLLLARYGVVARELASGEWSALRHALLRMEYGGEVVRGYFVQGLSGEQYALEDALTDLAAGSRRAEPHVLVNITDPANLWGRMFPLSRAGGSRVSAARIPTTWLVMRSGRPIVVAEGQGRDLTPLAGFEDVDLPGAVRALQSVFDRPPSLRPVRRLEVLAWDGRPVRDTLALGALVDAGFTVDGPRVTWDGHPGPR